jgi:hypothetical protein
LYCEEKINGTSPELIENIEIPEVVIQEVSINASNQDWEKNTIDIIKKME